MLGNFSVGEYLNTEKETSALPYVDGDCTQFSSYSGPFSLLREGYSILERLILHYHSGFGFAACIFPAVTGFSIWKDSGLF